MARLLAWNEGRPLPLGTTLGWPRAQDADRMVLAFVRMAGESGPWGAIYGQPGTSPTLLTVAEPRNPDEVAQLGLKLWEGLKGHLPSPEDLAFDAGLDEEAKADKLREVVRERQLWLPGPSHVAMLHFLDYRYTHASAGEPEVVAKLNALGRACGWLFRESTRPGQVRVLDATRRLRSAFTFPADTPRQQHLGFLLGWLTSSGTRDVRLEAARVRERESVGITMDPELERRGLAEAVERYSAAKDDAELGKPPAAAIQAVLQGELARRYRLTLEALAAFDADGRPPNPKLGSILALGADEFFYQYWRRESRAASITDPEAPRFIGNDPETDFHPSAAAARYFAHLHAAELTLSELVHGDPELVEAAVNSGDALRGRITRVVDEGLSRAVVPVWTVEAAADGPLRFREGSEVCVAGLRGRTGPVRSLVTDRGTRTVVIEIRGWKGERPDDGAPAADDPALVGTEVVLLDAGVVGLSLKKSIRVWDASGPGAWLTHSAPAPEPGLRQPPGGDLVALVAKLGKG
jgi:hypothetical protein